MLLAPKQAPASTEEIPYLKAHLKNGELYVLDSWKLAPEGPRLEGTGTRYTVLRAPSGTGSQSIPVDSIALVETNTRERVTSNGLGVLRALPGMAAIVLVMRDR